MDSPGFVWLQFRFCLASTTRLIQIRSGAEHRISLLLLSSLPAPGFVCLLSHNACMVLFGFRNSLNTNPKGSGTSDHFILTFEQFAWIQWRIQDGAFGANAPPPPPPPDPSRNCIQDRDTLIEQSQCS